MFFDPLYMLVLGVGFLLSMGAKFWVEHRVSRWSEVETRSGMTGRDVAESILRAEGIRDVRVEPTEGFLSDHYSPSEKVLRLSPENYHEPTITAAGIAAHEVGHALQDAQGYWPMSLRQRMVPVAQIGSNLGILVTIAGILVGLTELAAVGVALFGGFVAFTLVTLPVEINASTRAREVLLDHGILTHDEAEGVDEILTAAAATYVAAAAAAILQLLYWALRAGLIGGRD
jgi:hypothetical protein